MRSLAVTTAAAVVSPPCRGTLPAPRSRDAALAHALREQSNASLAPVFRGGRGDRQFHPEFLPCGREIGGYRLTFRPP